MQEMLGPVSTLVAAACLATPVSGNRVVAPPFKGGIAPQYDVVGGRFALHVGGVRDRRTGLSQKILWVLPARYRKSAGPGLAVTGRLNGIVRFRQWFPGAGVPGDPALYFPSNIAPPTAGCWTLTLTTGQLKARLIVLVRS